MRPAFAVALGVAGVLLAFCAFGIYGGVVVWYSDFPERVVFSVQMVPWPGWFLIGITSMTLAVQVVFIVVTRTLLQISWLAIALHLILPWMTGILFFEFLWLVRL